jgi:hypothetical protein
MSPLLPWKLCPSSNCMNLPLSLGECALLLLLLSFLHELNRSLEKSDSSPSHSSSPQSVHPLSLKSCLDAFLMCTFSNPLSPLSDSSLSLEINDHDLIFIKSLYKNKVTREKCTWSLPHVGRHLCRSTSKLPNLTTRDGN